MNQEEIQKKWAEIVAKAWSDEEFKKRLKQNPKKVLQEFGIEPSHAHLQIFENTKEEHCLVLPEKPKATFLKKN